MMVGVSKTMRQLLAERRRLHERIRSFEAALARLWSGKDSQSSLQAYLFDLSPCMLSIRRASDRAYLEVNETWLACTGLSREEVIGRNATQLGINVDESSCRQREKTVQTLHYDQSEVAYRTKSGQIRTSLIRTHLIQFNGESCYMNAAIDITEVKEMERQVERLDRLRLVGEMAASIGHEIRNPMTTVRGYLQVLQTKPDFQKYNEQMTLMVEELDRANGIISDFLKLAKNKAIELRQLNLASVVTRLYPLLNTETILRGNSLILNLEGSAMVLADENEIHQLILNLVRNALDASSNGTPITLRVFQSDTHCVLAVEDKGAGIPSDILDNLGAPFLTTKESGTGLGLAVCFSIAERHHASIQVQTSLKGTVMSVVFPKSAEEVARPTALVQEK